MADTPEDFPPCFALSSTMGRSRAYDLLLREAGKILNSPPSRVPLSPRRRTRRTKRHTPARLAKRSRPGNTSSQPSVPFPSTASSQACRGSCRGHFEPPCTRTYPLLPAIMHGSAGNQRPATSIVYISRPPPGNIPTLPQLPPTRPKPPWTTTVSCLLSQAPRFPPSALPTPSRRERRPGALATAVSSGQCHRQLM
ncbi:hypothetical protein HPB50_025646 [Hyalomma asiaticum]|uniref:Uncharacterized protein n=1 Tax=Hyalomma asiaticum TaxID=266040 RepID=A0ACB7TR89_HYAAI|nr:hypothetical protein HPB50_025646 [Hyalomma asiaticum]